MNTNTMQTVQFDSITDVLTLDGQRVAWLCGGRLVYLCRAGSTITTRVQCPTHAAALRLVRRWLGW
jgi:hypothetical protein